MVGVRERRLWRMAALGCRGGGCGARAGDVVRRSGAGALYRRERRLGFAGMLRRPATGLMAVGLAWLCAGVNARRAGDATARPAALCFVNGASGRRGDARRRPPQAALCHGRRRCAPGRRRARAGQSFGRRRDASWAGASGAGQRGAARVGAARRLWCGGRGRAHAAGRRGTAGARGRGARSGLGGRAGNEREREKGGGQANRSGAGRGSAAGRPSGAEGGGAERAG